MNNFVVEEFLSTLKRLRAPDGCPWDREQTHESLRKYLVEECYEVIDSIDSGSPEKLKEELGDLLLQICLHAEIASEKNLFDFGLSFFSPLQCAFGGPDEGAKKN